MKTKGKRDETDFIALTFKSLAHRSLNLSTTYTCIKELLKNWTLGFFDSWISVKTMINGFNSNFASYY
jgi:hypothetical protein